MSNSNLLPIPKRILTNLFEQWAMEYPAIEKVTFCRGRKPINHVLLIKPDSKADPEESINLKNWIENQATTALRDIEHEYQLCGKKFNIDEWQCWIDDGKPNEFITSKVEDLYPIPKAEEKAAFFIDSSILPDHELIEQSHREAWQSSCIKWAVENRVIKASQLVCILAHDKTYIPPLSKMWKEHQLNTEGDDCPDTNSFDARVNIWASLFQLWIEKKIFGKNAPFAIDTLETKRQENTNIEGETQTDYIIHLGELAAFFIKRNIPLPDRLFPKKTTNAPPPIYPVGGRSITSFCHPKPDYNKWKKMAVWDLHQASYLLCDCDPDYEKKLSSLKKIQPTLKEKVTDTYEIVYSAFVSDELPTKVPPFDKTCVDPYKFLEWASGKGFDLPDELRSFYLVSEEKALKVKEPTDRAIDDLILTARANKYIGDSDLAKLLALDNQCSEMLLELWKRFNLDSRKQIPNLHDLDNRIVAWFHLLTRWITGTIAGAPASQSMKLLDYKPGEPGYIELEALKDFFERWEIPLPQKLYADQTVKKNAEECTEESEDARILKYGIPAKRLYDLMKVHLKTEGKTLTESEKVHRHDAVVRIFDGNPSAFIPLKKEHIDINEPYNADRQTERKMVGTILARAVPEAGSDYQKLYARFRNLIKDNDLIPSLK